MFKDLIIEWKKFRRRKRKEDSEDRGFEVSVTGSGLPKRGEEGTGPYGSPYPPNDPSRGVGYPYP